MPTTKWKALVLALIVAFCCSLAVGASVARAEDFEDVPLEKLQEEMDELMAKGKWARSGKLTEQIARCNDETYEQPFLPWGDPANYILVPDGTLDAGAGWDLKGDAAIVGGGSPYYGASAGDGALYLPDHGEAITPAMCISVFHPTIRFFAANPAGPKLRLTIEVLYEDVKGKVKKLKIAKLRGGTNWTPSAPVLLQVNLRAAASENGITAVAFRFTTKKVGDKEAVLGDEGYLARPTLAAAEEPEPGWLVDDVFVDPFRAR
jgi:hypothetical protein